MTSKEFHRDFDKIRDCIRRGRRKDLEKWIAGLEGQEFDNARYLLMAFDEGAHLQKSGYIKEGKNT